MSELAFAAIGGFGVWLLFSAFTTPTSHRAKTPPLREQLRRAVTDWLAQAGLESVAIGEVAGAVLLVSAASGVLGALVFGGAVPALLIALLAAGLPIGTFRSRRRARLEAAHEAWPHLLDELRVLTSAAGRSIPQALFDVGRRAPQELRAAFFVAEREWRRTTDFERALSVLQQALGDPTADAVCETLVVANALGGTSLDRRLEALVEDRVLDVQGRKDAKARQAGVRFARRFVLFVPLGMALVGLSLGPGRSGYATPLGQAGVATGVLVVGMCWWWAGRLMRLPRADRVFVS